ncbi:MAG: aminotransferase class V-fold PLP-dependent enzyme [Parafilimonas terrae]|nr:aminotransferase class V-fold PLP-dependent enzyme [Parafilimonas terrae]
MVLAHKAFFGASIQEIGRMAAAGDVVAEAAGSDRAVDVAASGADFTLFSFYKVYGPHFAVMVGRYDQLLELDGLYHYFYGRERVPHKLEPGNVSYEAAWSCTAIVDYVEALGGGRGRPAIEAAFALMAEQEEALSRRLLDGLSGLRGLRVVGSRDPDRAVRVPTVCFKAEGRDAADIVRHVDAAKVGIRHGDFHSRRLVEALGLADRNGVLRASLVHYNTLAEVDRLLEALDAAL